MALDASKSVPLATLKEVSSRIDYGFTASADAGDNGPKFLRITDIVGGSVEWKKVPRCEITLHEIRKFELQIGDIVIARTGGSVGSNIAFGGSESTVFASYLVRFRIDALRADPTYVAQVLQTQLWKSYVASTAEGSAQPQLNAKLMGAFAFPLPPLRTQRAVGSILAVINDRITSCREQASTLESIAAAIFKSRFVDFDGITEFEDSEIGPIPAGWTAVPVRERGTVLGGSTPSTKDESFWDGEHAWLTPKDMSSVHGPAVWKTARTLTAGGLQVLKSGLSPAGTFVMSSRAPIGYCGILGVPMAINQGMLAIRESKLPAWYWYFWTQQHMEMIEAYAGGSTFPEISKKTFGQLVALAPAMGALSDLDALVGPVFTRIERLARQAAALTEIRDALLPKLVSGELEVPASLLEVYGGEAPAAAV